MKRIISTLLVVLCVAGVCCGCGSKESWMPYDLEFGMTYDESQEVFEDMPELEKSDSNNGYLTKSFFPDDEEVKEFFGFEDEYPTISYSFSFNENKELYEFMSGGTVLSEGRAEKLYNSLVDFYTEKTGIEAEEKEYSDGLESSLETDEVGVSVCMLVQEDSFFVFSVVHNKEFEQKD